jgi:MFS family permease
MRRRLVPALLRERVFRRYWSASTISMFGDQISGIALPLAAVIALHAGAAQMGYLTALEWLPSLLFGLPAGAWVDRQGRRRATMIAADLGRAALLSSIPACYALHALTMPQLYLVTFGAGTLSILFNVSDATLFVSIVAPERYVDGQSLIYGSRALSFAGGPSVGGVLVQLLSAPFAVVADALSFLGSAFFLSRIRPAEPPADDAPGSVTAGVRFIARSRVVRASLLGVAVINFFNLMFGALDMLYAVRVLHIRPGVLGLLLSAAAVGGLLGALVTKPIAARFGEGWAYTAGCLMFTAPVAGWPLARGSTASILSLLFASMFLIGFGLMMLDISIGAIFAAEIPDRLRSRVTGAFQAVNYGTRPAGALLGGLLGSAFGLRSALWVAAVGGVAGFLLLLPSPLPGYRLPSVGVIAPEPLEVAEDLGQITVADRLDGDVGSGHQADLAPAAALPDLDVAEQRVTGHDHRRSARVGRLRGPVADVSGVRAQRADAGRPAVGQDQLDPPGAGDDLHGDLAVGAGGLGEVDRDPACGGLGGDPRRDDPIAGLPDVGGGGPQDQSLRLAGDARVRPEEGRGGGRGLRR